MDDVEYEEESLDVGPQIARDRLGTDIEQETLRLKQCLAV